MLDMAKVTPEDYVIDLGLVTAARSSLPRNAAPARWASNTTRTWSLCRSAMPPRKVSADKAQFIKADLFESDFSQATVITMFLMPDINLRLRPQILDLKPGTRVVRIPSRWENGLPTRPSLWKTTRMRFLLHGLFWIVPAKVEGTWKLPQGELTLKQTFQKFSGTFKSGPSSTPVNGKLNGDLINFSIGNANYTGRVSGSTMQGTFIPGQTASHGAPPWRSSTNAISNLSLRGVTRSAGRRKQSRENRDCHALRARNDIVRR